MNNIQKGIATGIFALSGLVSCNDGYNPILLENSNLANGYDILVEDNGGHSTLRVGTLNDVKSTGFSEFIYAIDRNKDGRLDSIAFSTVKKDSPLEQMVFLPKLNTILSDALRENSKTLKTTQ